MSGIDLSAATMAAYRGWRSGQRGSVMPEMEFVATFSRLEAQWMTAAIAAAAPLIGEEIAKAIEAEMPYRDSAYRDGLVDATIIAREVTR